MTKIFFYKIFIRIEQYSSYYTTVNFLKTKKINRRLYFSIRLLGLKTHLINEPALTKTTHKARSFLVAKVTKNKQVLQEDTMFKSKFYTIVLIFTTLALTLGSQQASSVVGRGLAQISSGSDEPIYIGNGPTMPTQPDVIEADLARSPQPHFSEDQFFSIPGSVLVPRTSSAYKQYTSSGCVRITSGDLFLTTSLNLPSGSNIIGFRLYYRDNNPNASVQAWITAYESGVSATDLALITSIDGLTSRWADVDHVVDTLHNSYAINVRLNDYNNLDVCGIRVTYTPPSIFGLGMPIIQK